MVWHVQSAPAALWSLLKPLSSHWRHTKNDRTELSMPCFSACIWKQKDFRKYPLIQPRTLNSKLQQMALPGQLPAASITISFLFPWTQHHVKKTQKSTFQYYLCKYFSLWPVPKHTCFCLWQWQMLLYGKKVNCTQSWKAGTTFSLCNNAHKLAAEEALFVTTDLTSDRDEDLFCFSHPLTASTDPLEHFKSCFYTIIKCSLNVISLLNGLLSSAISITKALNK